MSEIATATTTHDGAAGHRDSNEKLGYLYRIYVILSLYTCIFKPCVHRYGFGCLSSKIPFQRCHGICFVFFYLIVYFGQQNWFFSLSYFPFQTSDNQTSNR